MGLGCLNFPVCWLWREWAGRDWWRSEELGVKDMGGAQKKRPLWVFGRTRGGLKHWQDAFYPKSAAGVRATCPSFRTVLY